MEDISRELEGEIKRSRLKPYKKNRKSRILIIDDFGEIRSGEYLKALLGILSAVSILFFVAAVTFYFTGVSRGVALIKKKLVQSEKKVDELTREKELLMARLVILGKDPKIIKKEIEEKKTVVSKNREVNCVQELENRVKTNQFSTAEQQENRIQSKLNASKLNTIDKPPDTSAKPKEMKKTVLIEKFAVKKDGTNGDLLVRFNIKNSSNKPGDVSGRIFTLLKPDNNIEDQWLVVPASALKNGIPSEYGKGQYFSIAHFKPVKFRIKSQADPEFFKKAAIFIFNDQGDLIFDKMIDITEA
ncbi:hypothetical protein [Desulfobacula toluolica]|uniref:Conserved uncharacterized protein n=1 Tax=Desulfobacula toluolica (strain DSM 7467 / Tol2) TaxID=651182 RepID=K0NLG3_DESTT|nr:hypothetical protein [Desulfobacula toluolica]CCK79522.1 conserved uncharacterized protein [Desulfobacula toluolica Tol2]